MQCTNCTVTDSGSSFYSSLCLTLSFSRGHDLLKIIYMFYSLLQTFSAYLGNYHLLAPQYVFHNWIVLLQHILNDSICLNGITLLWILLKTWYNAGPMIYNSASHCLFLGYRDFNTNMSPFNILKIFKKWLRPKKRMEIFCQIIERNALLYIK